MKNEFIWIGTTAILEIVTMGLLVGLLYYFIDIVRWSCFIDVLGVGVRLKLRRLVSFITCLILLRFKFIYFIESLKSSWDTQSFTVLLILPIREIRFKYLQNNNIDLR
jgi:hypothetical protein